MSVDTGSPRVVAPRSRPGILERTFSAPGLIVGALFFAASLAPSLLPRAGYVQGIASGITFMIGYGIGAGAQALWSYLGIGSLHGRLRQVVVGILVGLVALVTVLGVWRQVGWQNEVRAIFGMEPVSWTAWPVILVVAVVVAALILIVSRSLRALFATVGGWLSRVLPRRLAVGLGAGGLLLLLWLLWSGVLVNGFFAVAGAMFSTRDGATAEGVTPTQSALRSGGPDSQVAWDELGRQGRSFVSRGPTVAQIDAFSGGGAVEPIRVYVGLKSAPTLEERSQLLLDELVRTGAFDREAIVIATTTGTGFLDPHGVDPVDYLFNGDVAIAGLQYSYLPSWISLLADQDAVRETAQVSFQTIHDYWSTLPEDDRPDLYLYGLSLGSLGVESVLDTVNIINEPIAGAVMTGPPFVNDLHARLVAQRDAGSPANLPVYGQGRTVRFTDQADTAEVVAEDWGPTRLVYLQYGSDPIVFFSPSLAFSPPDWLKEGQRAPDVSERMGWFPLVTMWQVLLDLPGAGGVPYGYGHLYSIRDNVESWVAAVQPEGWTGEDTDRLVAAIEAQGETED